MNESIHYLYLITRSDGEKYVGVSKCPDIRFRNHKVGRGSIHLKGYSDLTMEIITSGSKDIIYSLEDVAIEYFKAALNIASGGVGGNTGPKSVSFEGFNNPNAVLTEDQVVEIRNKAAQGVTFSDLAKEYRSTYKNIRSICGGLSWKNTSGPITVRSLSLPSDVINKILSLRKLGLSHRKIAAQLNISKSSVTKYCTEIE